MYINSIKGGNQKLNYLVTGGAGFIGSHLVDRLLKEGNCVSIIENFDDFYDRSIKENNISHALKYRDFNPIEGDIRDEKLLYKIFNDNKIDVVVHLAAKAGVRPSIMHPLEYYDVNVMGTLKLLEAMKTYGCKKMIFASSSSVYGNNKKIPFSEEDDVDSPISPYAATKKAGELLCHTYHHLYGFDIFCLRFFTVYGPRQRPDLAIHKFTKLITQGKPIPVFGDGNTCRDYTYIDDILQGIYSAIINLNGFEVINLGDSKTISLHKMIEVIEAEVGKKAIIEFLPEQLGDVKRTHADISKAKKILNYQPQVKFEEGIKEFVKWYQENKEGD